MINHFMLSLCIWREARGESFLGKRLVADVVLNRTRDADARWPVTIREVIMQPLQFSSFNRSDPQVIIYPATDDISWWDSVRAAEMEMNKRTLMTGANHYHAANVKPSWADPTKLVVTEGHHLFYAL